MTGKELREVRSELGLSQRGFAELVGVSPNTVARWERGELAMRATTSRFIELIAKQHASGKAASKRKAR
jgi:DNA-binding transcriptional regulator YiaG